MGSQDVAMATQGVVVTDTQVVATQGLMIQDVVVGTPVVVVDTQGTAVTDTQKTGDIMYLTALYMTRESDVQYVILYSHCTMSCIYSLMSTFQAVPVLFCTIKEDEDEGGGGHGA